MKKNCFCQVRLGMIVAAWVVCWGIIGPLETQNVNASQNNASQNNARPTQKVGAASKMTFASLPDVVAEVNSVPITKAQLAEEALKVYGKEYLGRLINRSLIDQECRKMGVTITQEEVVNEMKLISEEQFKVPLDQWLTMLKKERGIAPDQYANEIIWPRLALKKLAGQKLSISKEEIDREFDSKYGPSVQMRQIVAFTKEKADGIMKQLAANPSEESFISIAKQQSEDTVSASAGGLIAPFFHYVQKDPNLEQRLFSLQPGQISPVLQIEKDYYVIFRCERHLPPQNVDRTRLEKQIAFIVQDKKLQEASAETYARLTRNANVENAFDQNNLVQIPETIARINGHSIARQEIAEQCAVHYGSQVLSDMIGRKMLEVECTKRNIQVTQVDIDEELADLAMKYLASPDGRPNVQGWIDLKCREMSIPPSMYVTNTVWPLVALKKLAGPGVQVTDEDLQKAFEANFGPKVKCLAIILESQRKAQEVWALARKSSSPTDFSDLASQHSIEPTSRALSGEMDPIQKYGGMPELENAAFTLRPGDLSEIIPMVIGTDQRFVILYCQGYTDPVTSSIAEVREILTRDIYEKRLELEMERTFQSIYASATVDNYFDGKVMKPTPTAPQQIASPGNNNKRTK